MTLPRDVTLTTRTLHGAAVPTVYQVRLRGIVIAERITFISDSDVPGLLAEHAAKQAALKESARLTSIRRGYTKFGRDAYPQPRGVRYDLEEGSP